MLFKKLHFISANTFTFMYYPQAIKSSQLGLLFTVSIYHINSASFNFGRDKTLFVDLYVIIWETIIW